VDGDIHSKIQSSSFDIRHFVAAPFSIQSSAFDIHHLLLLVSFSIQSSLFAIRATRDTPFPFFFGSLAFSFWRFLPLCLGAAGLCPTVP
jgi:hypothetical protein